MRLLRVGVELHSEQLIKKELQQTADYFLSPPTMISRRAFCYCQYIVIIHVFSNIFYFNYSIEMPYQKGYYKR